MSTVTISSKYQIVIPKEIREKLQLSPQQRFIVIEKGGVISLIPELDFRSLKGLIKGVDSEGIRDKKDRF